MADPTDIDARALAIRSAVADRSRLAALRRVGLLDSAPEEDFDRLTRLASRLLKAPVALVSLVDEHRQFFKSSVGLPEPWASARETPLSHSFCQIVTADRAPLIVNDAVNDARVAGNGAIADLGVMAYAGFPLVDGSGHVLGSFCVIDTDPRTWAEDELALIEDLTEAVVAEIELRAAAADARAAQARLGLLAEFSAVLAESFEWIETLQRASEIVVPAFCDWCAFLVLEGDQLRRVAYAGATEELTAIGDRLRIRAAVYDDPTNVLSEVVERQRPILLDPVTEETLVGRTTAQQRELYLRLGLGSLAIVPMAARGRAQGAVVLGRLAGTAGFDDEDLRFAGELAGRAAVAFDNSQLFERERHIATALQRSLLPPHLPDIADLEVAATYRAGGSQAAAVGGDFYDLFPLEGEEWGVAIGDVCGKGPEAAALTALMRYTVRAAAVRSGTPAQTLWLLNEALQRDDGLGERFCTASYATLRPVETGTEVCIAVGGHPLGVVARATGEVELLGRPGTLLGVVDEPLLLDETTVLASGDALILMTDGVLEARDENGEEFGLTRAVDVVRRAIGQSAASIAAALDDAVLAFQGGTPRDDTAIVVLRRL